MNVNNTSHSSIPYLSMQKKRKESFDQWIQLKKDVFIYFLSFEMINILGDLSQQFLQQSGKVF